VVSSNGQMMMRMEEVVDLDLDLGLDHQDEVVVGAEERTSVDLLLAVSFPSSPRLDGLENEADR
jgi:hypothetical protein